MTSIAFQWRIVQKRRKRMWRRRRMLTRVFAMIVTVLTKVHNVRNGVPMYSITF
jgi:hypothetical protein